MNEFTFSVNQLTSLVNPFSRFVGLSSVNRSFILPGVSDSLPVPPSLEPAPTIPTEIPEPASASAAFRFPREFFFALSHPFRVWLVRRLLDGAELTATEVARERGRKFFTVNTHCKTLRDAGVIASLPGLDRRSEVYFIPAENRREPGWLDYGWCRFQVR